MVGVLRTHPYYNQKFNADKVEYSGYLDKNIHIIMSANFPRDFISRV